MSETVTYFQHLRKIVVELEAMGVSADVEHPSVIVGGHDDTWFSAGFANGGLGIDIYLDPEMSEYTGSAESGFKLDGDPKLAAAFIAGAYLSHLA